MSQMNTSQSQVPAGSGKLVVVALVLAIMAVLLVNLYIFYVQQASKPNEITVYRLKFRVRPGEKLTRKMIEPLKVNEAYREALGQPLNEKGIENRLGQLFARNARQGQVLTSGLFDANDLQRLDMEIDQGKRSIALPVESRILPGALREGVYVDIAAPFTTPNGSTQILPVMENVQVMVAGTNSVIDEEESLTLSAVPRSDFRRIDIQVTPAEAIQLSQIKKIVTGGFEIYVRNPGDKKFELIESGGINPVVLQMLP